jgi:hypothetical protein
MCLKQYYTFYEQHGINTIELHAPTSSTQKLKLIGKGGQFTYTPTNTKVQKFGIFSITAWGIGSRDINVYLHKIPSFSVWEKNLKAEVTK